MVGYNHEDKMTSNQKLVAGCVAGVMTRFITQPMDLIKIRTQLEKSSGKHLKKWFGVTRRVLREEGMLAFWHGHNLGQIHSILAVSSQFFVYEMATKFVTKSNTDQRSKQVGTFLSGVLAGCCSTALVIPLEVIRVRQMVISGQYKGLLNGARAVYNSGGVLAFYEGLTASLCQMGPQVGISFCVFSFLQPLMLSYFSDKCLGGQCQHAPGNAHRPEYLLMASTLAGSVAGFVSKSVTYPFDLAKRRLQLGSHKDDAQQTPRQRKLIKCKNLTDCLIKTYHIEGVWGLYRGWKVTIYKAQVTSVMAFTTYELMCYSIREMSQG